MTRVASWIIEGGLVFDGLGGEPAVADVLVRDGRIAALGPPLGPALEGHDARRLPAAGLAVAPGFIDLHSHADLILALPPEARRSLQRGKLLQGITTEFAGNCGLGAAPLTPASAEQVRAVVSWMTPDGVAWGWDGFGSYLECIEESPLPMNAGFLAAHGPIRAAALGMEAVRADARAIDRMQGLVREALSAGAFGLSSGLIYPPGMHADTDELVATALPLGGANAVFTSHIRGSSETLLPAVDELLEVGRRAGCAVHHSHSEAVGPAHWEKIGQVLAAEENARSRGQRVTFDLFPYHAAATMMAAIYPPWALAGGIESLLERLEADSERARIRRAVESQIPSWPPWEKDGWPHNLVLACGYERIFVARTGGRSGGRFDGLSLAALGDVRGIDPFDAVSDLMIEERGEVGQWIFGISGEEGADHPLAQLLESPFAAVATDACEYGSGAPHPAAYGTFPRILSRYVRERRLLTLPEAIRRMTSLPAAVMGLSGRGRLAPGYAADIVVFDPGSIADRATFEEPRALAHGIHHLFVNGVPAVLDGATTDRDAGQLLRRR